MRKELSEMTLEELWQLFPIILKEHNPDYKAWYREEKESIIQWVGEDKIARISHIGSTAVEGLLAKPTVDILLEIHPDCDTAALKAVLADRGWKMMAYRAEPDLQMDFNKGYTPEGFAEKVYHLHIRRSGDWDELYFCDYLKEHKDAAEGYARLKQELSEQYRNNRDGYTEAKRDFILNYTKLARECYGNSYLPG